MISLESGDFEELVAAFPRDLQLAFAYGSGAVTQASYEYENKNSKELPMLDLIFAVEDAEAWHAENKKRHPGHYTSLVDLSPKCIAWMQNQIGARVWFNAMVPMGISSQAERLMKYGVIDLANLQRDLVDWETGLYVAGRLHKPVKLIRSTPDLDEMMEINRMNAVMTALALLPSKFDELELYTTIASLSYTGDPRMGIGENPNKVANLVTPILPAYRELYKNALQSIDSGLLRKAYIPEGDRTVFVQDDRADARRFIQSQIPRSIQRELPSRGISQAEDVRDAVATVVARAATPQTAKGIFTAGAMKSAVYAAAKIAKRFKK